MWRNMLKIVKAIPVQLYMTTFNYVQLPKNKLTMYSRREEV